MKRKHPPGEPMTLGNMRHLGVQRLVATCLNDVCRHQGFSDVSTYPAALTARLKVDDCQLGSATQLN
jgi:hypothetical protein